MGKSITIDADAFSSGQILSKTWLVDELYYASAHLPNPIIWILGGWQGILGFLLLSQCNWIKHIRSFDIDPTCAPIADTINEAWVSDKWRFKAFTADANKLRYDRVTDYGELPDIVINTSAEHFSSMDWWNNIPKGMLVVVQTNNMKHDDHVFQHQSISEHAAQFPMNNVGFLGKLPFVYPDWSFERYMSIGIK